MRKYLELFTSNLPSDIANKIAPANWPYVGYSVAEDKVVYTEIPSGEELDPTAGFVDLGLSVMWASCDVGATSPEGEGTKYAWGEDSWKTIPLEFDPVYINSGIEWKWKEALQPRTPSPEQVQELLDNTTATEEVLNGVYGVRYTASNGNSIFVSNAERWTNATYIEGGTYTGVYRTAVAVHWSPNGGVIENTTSILQELIYKSDLLSFRGVCNYLPQGGAQLLKHGQNVAISAQSKQLYCFPKAWGGTEFTAPTTGVVKLFVSTMANFSASAEDENVLKVYELDKVNNRRMLQMSSKEMSVLTSRATSDYIYVRMTSENPTTLSINEWMVSSCADNSTLIRANKEQSINTNAWQRVYRLRYDEFSGYPITITWAGNSSLPMFLAEDCNLDLSTNKSNLLIKPAPVIARKSSLTIDADTVDSWAYRIGEDGFMYVKFNPYNNGRVTFHTEKPADADPVSTASTTSTDCGCTN